MYWYFEYFQLCFCDAAHPFDQRPLSGSQCCGCDTLWLHLCVAVTLYGYNPVWLWTVGLHISVALTQYGSICVALTLYGFTSVWLSRSTPVKNCHYMAPHFCSVLLSCPKAVWLQYSMAPLHICVTLLANSCLAVLLYGSTAVWLELPAIRNFHILGPVIHC